MILVTAVGTAFAFAMAAAIGRLSQSKLGAVLAFVVAFFAGWSGGYTAAWFAFHHHPISENAIMTLFATALCAALAGAVTGLDVGIRARRARRDDSPAPLHRPTARRTVV